MAGYNDYSMSNNAVDAYASGEMPLSKWTKSAVLDQIKDYLDSRDNSEYFSKFQSMSIEELRRLLRVSSWHHTSKNFNKTNFYALNEDAVDAIAESGEDADFVLIHNGQYSSHEKSEDGLYFTDNINKARRVTEYAANAHIKIASKYNTVWTKLHREVI